MDTRNNKPQDTKQIKVMHLIDSGGVYGAEVMLLHLIKEQLRDSVSPILGSIGRKGEGEKPFETVAKSNAITVKRFTASKGVDLPAGIKIIYWAKKNNIDIIHTHGFKPNLLIAFFPRKWRKIPIIRTLHGWTSTTMWSKIGIYQMLDVLSLSYTEALFAVSGAMLQKKPLLNSSLQIGVIENGIKQPEFNKATDNEIKTDKIYNFCTNSHMLLSVGRLSKEKGFDNLIGAIALLVHDNIDVKLCIIGEGPQQKQLDTLISEHNLHDRVFLAGYRDKAFRFMPIFDTYILSSHTEGLPITILEAMHMGIPIVATQVGGVPEALDEGLAGSLLDSNDPTHIYEHLKVFIKNTSKRDTIRGNAKERAQTVYTASTMAQKYKKAYLHLLNIPQQTGH